MLRKNKSLRSLARMLLKLKSLKRRRLEKRRLNYVKRREEKLSISTITNVSLLLTRTKVSSGFNTWP
jgi:hypothetical protein